MCAGRADRATGSWTITMPLRGLYGLLLAFAPPLAVGLVAVVLALRSL